MILPEKRPDRRGENLKMGETGQRGKQNKKAVVIIPNFNGLRYIRECLESLNRQTFGDFYVCVVDNGSEDGSCELIEREFPETELIRLDKNYGFARAVNEGIRKTSSEYVVLLNNDVVVNKNFLEKLYKAIDNRKSVFSYQAKMLKLFEKDRIDSAGDLYCALGWAFALGKDRPAKAYDEDCALFSACGGAAIYRRELFEKTGMFDERHFCYLEDVDLCYRARINGYSVRFCPEALVYHAGSATSGSRHNAFKVRLSARNNIFLLYKNMPLIQLILNLPLLIAGHLIKLCFFTKKGLGRAYAGGIYEGFKLCAQAEKYRFRPENFVNYLRLQLELWINTIRRVTG